MSLAGGWGDSWGKKKDKNKPQDGAEGSSEQTTDKWSNWGCNRKEEQKQDQGGCKMKKGWVPKRDHPARPVGGLNDGLGSV
uniref:Nuclear RNA polymerase D1B n=1 Tax=Tanacetum cinerariifolium TaxID=118510 RepID=A0A699I7G7_TANCI|nr:nuclear RNA polymerase D1B [Tanacetum cinerariifolium]